MRFECLLHGETNLHASCTLKPYLVEADDLTVGLLDLSQLGKEVPETALRDHIVGSKDAHAVELWRRVGIGRQMTADDLVFLQATCFTTESALSYGRIDNPMCMSTEAP
jgi:hypothetical protein